MWREYSSLKFGSNGAINAQLSICPTAFTGKDLHEQTANGLEIYKSLGDNENPRLKIWGLWETR